MARRQPSSEPIEWRRGRSWVSVANPYRVNHPLDARFARLNRIRDRFRDYLCGVALTVTGGVAVPLITAAGAAPLTAAATGVGAAAVAVTFAARRYGTAFSTASAACTSLTDDVGPPKIRSADLLDPDLTVQANRAVSAAQQILDSVALEHGTLGDPLAARTEVHQVLWRILRGAAAVDRRSAAVRHLEAQLASLQVPDRVVADELAAAKSVRDEVTDAVTTAAGEVVAQAARVAELDQRLLTPAARDAAAALISPIDVDSDSLSPGGLFGSLIDSANQVLDARGSTPTSLPLNRRRT